MSQNRKELIAVILLVLSRREGKQINFYKLQEACAQIADAEFLSSLVEAAEQLGFISIDKSAYLPCLITLTDRGAAWADKLTDTINLKPLPEAPIFPEERTLILGLLCCVLGALGILACAVITQAVRYSIL